MLVHRLVVIIHFGGSVDHVAGAIAARAARRLAHREQQLAAGEMLMLGDLRVGSARATEDGE